MICRQVHYSGRVQGVGFRYTTARIARRFPVVGFVKNLPDGRVQLVAEGPQDDVDRFLKDVAAAMSDYIQQTTSEELPASGKFTQFDIRF